MDQLDILKKNWNSQSSDSPRFSTDQLRKLIASKSTGIVKWLFIIAVIEFIFFIIVGIIGHFYNTKQGVDVVELMGGFLYYGMTIVHYIFIISFIYLFYKNYQNISVAQPTRTLMTNILKTRRTMKWYIWYNVVFIMISGMISALVVLPQDPNIKKMMEAPNMVGHETAFYFMILGIAFVTFLIICIVMYLIYQLIYGILLRKLKRNYNELKRIEV